MSDKTIVSFKLKLQPLIVCTARRLRWCLMGGRREWVGGKKGAESADGRPQADWSSAEWRPQNLNPPQVLSAPQVSNPPHLSPEGAFALTSVLASIVMRRPLHASYLLVSHSPLPSIQVLYHTSDHGIGFPRTKPLTPYHTAPCMAITSCLTALPKLCHRHHRWATSPPPLSLMIVA